MAPSSADLSQVCASHGSHFYCQQQGSFLEEQLSLSLYWPGFRHSGSLTSLLDAKTLESLINGQTVSQQVNDNLMAITPDSKTRGNEPSLTLSAPDELFLKQHINIRSNKLGNPQCQPCSKCFAAATRFGCGRWIIGLARHNHTLCVLSVHKPDISGGEHKLQNLVQAFKCCWVWMSWFWDLSLAHYGEKSWQWFDMVGSFPNFVGVHSLGLLGSFLDYFADG